MKIKHMHHMGEYDTVAVVMWVFLIGLLVLPLIFGLLMAVGGAAIGSIGAVL